MIRPALGGNAFASVLVRDLCLDETGAALFVQDHPAERWAEIDEIEPTACRVAHMRVTLLSVSLDESTTRAVFEIDGFPCDSPMGPTRPRMGDLVVLEIGCGLHQSFRVELTSDDAADGADADLGPNELLLSRHTLFLRSFK